MIPSRTSSTLLWWNEQYGSSLHVYTTQSDWWTQRKCIDNNVLIVTNTYELLLLLFWLMETLRFFAYCFVFNSWMNTVIFHAQWAVLDQHSSNVNRFIDNSFCHQNNSKEHCCVSWNVHNVDCSQIICIPENNEQTEQIIYK